MQVTDVTPIIAGVTTREVHDRVWADNDCNGSRGYLLKNALDWYAQDDDGDVWYLGTDTAWYCDHENPGVAARKGRGWGAGMTPEELLGVPGPKRRRTRGQRKEKWKE